MRSRRKVTMQPIGTPSRSLKFAIAFFARVTTGFCPVIDVISATVVSTTLAFCVASPKPTFNVIFVQPRDLHGVLIAELLASSPERHRSDILFSIVPCAHHQSKASLQRRQMRIFVAVGEYFVADAHRRVTFIAHNHNIGGMNGGLFLDDPAGLLRPARLGMPLDDIEPFDNHSVFFQQHARAPCRSCPVPCRAITMTLSFFRICTSKLSSISV